MRVFLKKIRVEIKNEMRVFTESLNSENETRGLVDKCEKIGWDTNDRAEISANPGPREFLHPS